MRIGLITDFGEEDYFAGILKGVIAGINPQATVIDISHGIPSHSITAASFIVDQALNYFPPGTIFLVVVDPGVGSDRNILLVSTKQHYLIAPDNGSLTPVLVKKDKSVRLITTEKYFISTSPSTFEARDRMAPIAAYLSLEYDPKDFGYETHNYIINQDYFPSRISKNVIKGKLIYVDKFGNLITNISGKMVTDLQKKENKQLKIRFGSIEIRQMVNTYAEGSKTPFMLFGSHGFIEVAMNKKSASKTLKANLNQPIKAIFY